ncbi:hypothetical protein N2152v2_009652 [Parachlorella kessleri]
MCETGYLNLRALQPLSALERLVCSGWEHVELGGSAQLPRLSSLDFQFMSSIDIDAALPSLLSLRVEDVDAVRLAGTRLELARLSQLSLDADSVTIRWPALPSLVILDLNICYQLHSDGLLQRLSLGLPMDNASAADRRIQVRVRELR